MGMELSRSKGVFVINIALLTRTIRNSVRSGEVHTGIRDEESVIRGYRDWVTIWTINE